jgi:hypothetical protein
MSGINIPVTVTGADTAATQLGKVSGALGGVGTSTDKANDALKNVGKTIKDIPGGFEAIGNNVKPLAQSLGGLVAETGSVGSAFGELILALSGPAGIGIALAVATAGFKLLIESFSESKSGSTSLEDSLKGLSIQFDATKRDAQLLSSELDAAAKLRKLNFEINIPDKRQRLAAQLGEDLTDVQLKLNDLQKIQTALQNQSGPLIDLISKEGSQELNNLYGTIGDVNELRLRSLSLSDKDKKLVEEIVKRENELFKVGNEINILFKTKQTLNAQNILDLRALNEEENKRKEKIQEQKKAADSVAKTIAALREKLAVIGKEEELFNVDKTKDKINALTQTIQTLFSKFKLGVEAPQVQDLKSEIDLLNGIIIRNENIRLAVPINIEKPDINSLKTINDAIAAGIKFTTPPITDPFAEFRKKAEEFAKSTGDIIGNTLGDAFTGIGESIGNILSGKGGAGDLFGGIFKVLGEGLKTLGKFVIQSAILLDSVKKVLNSILAGPGGFIAGIALGIALISLGSFIQNSIPGFANGVTNFGGGVALVGERGPELVRLPSGSDVIPNYRLNSLSASSPMGYIPNVTLRGSDLVIAFNRQTATNRRNG